MAGLATSGTLTHWFRDELARDLPDAAFERLAAEAAAVPAGADGLIVLPYFSGERTPIHDPNAKGVLFGLNLTHTRGDISTAPCSRGSPAARPMPSRPTPRQALRRVGCWRSGAACRTRSGRRRRRISASSTRWSAAPAIGASYGDAFLAAVAVGDAAPDDIAAWNPEAHRIVARPTAARRRQLKLFKRLYAQTRDLMAAVPVPEDA